MQTSPIRTLHRFASAILDPLCVRLPVPWRLRHRPATSVAVPAGVSGAAHVAISVAVALILSSAITGCRTPHSGSPPKIAKGDEAIEKVLEQAGVNRGELETVLEHYSQAGDRQKLRAARYLIEHMGAHNYAVLALYDSSGTEVELDVLAYPDYEHLIEAVTAIERDRGELDYDRKLLEPDPEHITARFLIENIDLAFEAYRTKPWAQSLAFEDFLAYVLPYRGSNEPLESWRPFFLERYAGLADQMEDPTDPVEAAALVNKDLMTWFTFDSRFYLHPTDQGLAEMRRNGIGRCEDMTNLAIYAMRALSLAVTSDYTPYWADSGNNHAWNAILNREGEVLAFMGSEAPPGEYRLWNKLAKVYRKTYARQYENLAFQKDEDEAVPRWLAGRNYLDVTTEYGPTADPSIQLTRAVPDSLDYAYLCVFNSGRWGAIHWGAVQPTGGDYSMARFTDMGLDIAYLPALYQEDEIVAAAPAFILTAEGAVRQIEPRADAPVDLRLYSTTRRKQISDTDSVQEADFEAGETYELFYWDGEWISLGTRLAGEGPLHFHAAPSNALYWLVKEGSRKEERIFTYEEGQQVWW